MSGLDTFILWRESSDLAANVLDACDKLRRAGAAEFGKQMRLAAESIPANVAEGYGRGVNDDCLRFPGIARGSAIELESHLKTAKRQRRLDDNVVDPLIDQCIRVRYLIDRYAASVRRRKRK